MWEVKGIPMHYIHKGESLEDWEPFAIEQGSLGTVIVCRRQVKPEGQKIQDEWKAKLKDGKLTMKVDHEHRSPHCYQDNGNRVFDERCETCEAVRTQAIKDVARYLGKDCFVGCHRYFLTDKEMDILKNGKIPE